MLIVVLLCYPTLTNATKGCLFPSLPAQHVTHTFSQGGCSQRGCRPLPLASLRRRAPGAEPASGPSPTSFDADVGAPDLAGRVLRGAEVVIVVDKAIEGGGGEGVELQRPVGMHVPDVRHVVDVVPRGQVPSKGRTGGACGRAGHHHPHGAGKGHLLQGVIYKVEAGADIFRAGCRGGEGRDDASAGRR